MKIAILGTRGIPNNYGGFEQFAEYLSVGLVAVRSVMRLLIVRVRRVIAAPLSAVKWAAM